MSAVDGSTLRVLVVDDCTDTTTSLSMLLNLWGHDARVAHDGPGALEIARAYRPHVVLLDIALRARRDGYDVARQLRVMPGLEQMVLICLSGYAAPADHRRSQEAGFNLHIAKPADPEELKRLLTAEKAALLTRKTLSPSEEVAMIRPNQPRPNAELCERNGHSAYKFDGPMRVRRVLIADPDLSLLASYQRFLSERSYDVETATSGLECVGKLKSFLPDVLVLEPELPWGRGEGVLARIREEREMPCPAVLVVSTVLAPELLHDVDDLPVSAYYVKPLTPPELDQCIRRLLGVDLVPTNGA